jgi:predicted tellurium resistance membrane protein TerC
MLELLADPQAWLSLVTLTVLEIVLGIDNLVFIAVLVGKLPAAQQALARQLGIGVALGTRLLLLASIVWIAGLTQPAFTLLEHAISWRDLVLILGGLFLIYKSTHEIHGSLEGEQGETSAKVSAAFMAVVIQIGILDIVFSLDSVITAVGMAEHFEIMVAAVVIAMIVMLAAAGPVSGFVERHPTVKMLALSFLLLIGTALVADGMGFHIPKGYIYAAMGFSVMVEALNLLAKRRRAKPVELRHPYSSEPPTGPGA